MKQHRLRRLLGALFAALTLSVVAAPVASAHHTEVDGFYDTGHNRAAVWSNSGTEAYCYDSEFTARLSAQSLTNMKSTTEIAFDQWQNNTDFNREFNGSLGECSTDYNVMSEWAAANVTKSGALGETQAEEFCQNYMLNANSRIEHENMDPGVQAMTIKCDRDENEKIDFFIVLIDIETGAYTWDNVAPTAAKPVSFWAYMTHEAGHVIGFNIHWQPGSEVPCVNQSPDHNTMCDDGWGNYNGQGEATDSSIEPHDIGETNQAY